MDFTKILDPRLASTLARRSGGRRRHSAARPAGEKSRCTNQSAVTVVSSRRRSMPLSRARCSTKSSRESPSLLSQNDFLERERGGGKKES